MGRRKRKTADQFKESTFREEFLRKFDEAEMSILI